MRPKKPVNKERVGLKVISIFLAVLLWFYVANMNAPDAGQNSRKVNLEYTHVPAGMKVSGPQTVSVKLWGILKDIGEVEAYVDLMGREEGTYHLPVKVKSVSGALFSAVEPDTVEVTLAPIQKNEVPINYEVIVNPPAGYELVDVVFEPDRCLLQGDEEVLQKAASVIAQLNLGNVRDTGSFEAKLMARDKDGNLLDSGIEIIPRSTRVVAVIRETIDTKEVPIKAATVGEPLKGYEVRNVTLDIDTAAVVGNKTRLQDIEEINTASIDISGADESFTRQVELPVLEDVRIYPDSVKALVEIGKIPDGSQINEDNL